MERRETTKGLEILIQWKYGLDNMGEHERCKGMPPIAARRIFSSSPNLSGTLICMVDPTYDKEKE